MRRDRQSDLCKECSQTCHCGNRKDFRAAECLPCGMSRKAKKQWKQMRPKMMAGIIAMMKQKRRKFNDLKQEHFRQAKPDGRRYAYYWDGDRNRAIYDYQWIWIKYRGPIPKGMVIHHKDENPNNNRLSNLQLMTKAEHATHHGLTGPKTEWICQQCGTRFARSRKAVNSPRKFCSQPCHYAYPGKCNTYQPANEYTERLMKQT